MRKSAIAVAFVCGALVAGGISFASAEVGSDGGGQGMSRQTQGSEGHDWDHHGWGGHHGDPSVRAVMMDLHGMERLYLMEGRPKDVVAMYQSVLGKTTNPMLRNMIYARLARAELMPSNPDAAIGTLQKSLDENLDRVNSKTKADKADGT